MIFIFFHARVPGKIKRREVELDPQVSPEEIMSREVGLGCESWTSFASGCSSTAMQWTLSLWLCPAQQLKQQLRCALVAVPWQGDTALTLTLLWQRSMVFLVFLGQYPQLSFHSLALFPPPVPVPNKQPHFCGHKVKWSWSHADIFSGLVALCFIPHYLFLGTVAVSGTRVSKHVHICYVRSFWRFFCTNLFRVDICIDDV